MNIAGRELLSDDMVCHLGRKEQEFIRRLLSDWPYNKEMTYVLTPEMMIAFNGLIDSIRENEIGSGSTFEQMAKVHGWHWDRIRTGLYRVYEYQAREEFEELESGNTAYHAFAKWFSDLDDLFREEKNRGDWKDVQEEVKEILRELTKCINTAIHTESPRSVQSWF